MNHSYVVKLFESHGYPLDLKEVTLFGIRAKDWGIDEWTDTLGVIHGDKLIFGAGTTKPGKSPLTKTDGVNKNGIFILRPNFYKNCFQKGKHKGKYDALVQAGNVFEGWRDNDHDGQFDISATLWKDVQGLNFHSTREDKTVVRVGDFSEGCQVVHLWTKFQEIKNLAYESNQSLFSYALFQA
jgi:hypothetical protein